MCAQRNCFLPQTVSPWKQTDLYPFLGFHYYNPKTPCDHPYPSLHAWTQQNQLDSLIRDGNWFPQTRSSFTPQQTSSALCAHASLPSQPLSQGALVTNQITSCEVSCLKQTLIALPQRRKQIFSLKLFYWRNGSLVIVYIRSLASDKRALRNLKV